jgi:hypothetical protein
MAVLYFVVVERNTKRIFPMSSMLDDMRWK